MTLVNLIMIGHCSNTLETKETSAGKTLIWPILKQHLTSNYSEIPYDTHAINAYNTYNKAMMSPQKPTYTGPRTY